MTKNVPDNNKRYCNHCAKYVSTTIEILYGGPHYAKENCDECGKYVAFAKMPESVGKRAKNKHTAASLGKDYCEMCLRHKDRLGSRGILHVHHVEEVNCGGPDIPANIWVVCTSCHKLIHHQRTYVNKHLKVMYTIDELRQDMEADRVPKETREILERIFRKQEANNVD